MGGEWKGEREKELETSRETEKEKRKEKKREKEREPVSDKSSVKGNNNKKYQAYLVLTVSAGEVQHTFFCCFSYF
jgi:hypothetical protein